MSTWNGIGTKFMGFTGKMPDGTHHATKWFVICGLPVIPLRRYRLTVGKTEHFGGTSAAPT
jgi:hypothetical protein